MMFGTPLFWRETHKPGKFLIFEGRVVIVLLLMVMHIRPWTIALAFTVMGVLYFFDRKGVSADSILRYLRARLVGKRRTARGVHNERVPVDFHFEGRMLRQRRASPGPKGPKTRTDKKAPGLLSRIGLGRGPVTTPEASGKGGGSR
jgi:hypothetical protein